MRMWMTPPSLMCRRHLLGEHVELHMFAGTIRKGVSIQGYLDNKLLEPTQIKARHEALAHEIRRRHMSHNSPLPDFPTPSTQTHVVDMYANMEELRRRCPDCRRLLDGNKPVGVEMPIIMDEEGDWLVMEQF